MVKWISPIRKAREEQKRLEKKKKFFVKGLVLLAGAALLGGAGYIANLDIDSPREIVAQDIIPHKIVSSEKVVISGTKENRNFNSQEASEDLERILASASFKKADVRDSSLVSSYSYTYIGIEKDVKLGQRLARLGRDSINHMFDYFNSPYLIKEEFRFHVPQRAEEIVCDSPDGTEIYIVSNLGSILLKQHKYNVLQEYVLDVMYLGGLAITLEIIFAFHMEQD